MGMLKNVKIGEFGGRVEKHYIGDVRSGNVDLTGISSKNVRLDGVSCIGTRQSRLDNMLDEQITQAEIVNRQQIAIEKEVEEVGRIGAGLVNRAMGIDEEQENCEEKIAELLNGEFGVKSGQTRIQNPVSLRGESYSGAGSGGIGAYAGE